MNIKFKRLSPDIPLPQYQTSGSAAFDLASANDISVAPHDIVLVPTGLIVATPPGHMLMLASRSSLPLKRGLTLANGIGIVDSDYQGPEDEVKIQVINLTDRIVEIKKGDRIAQGCFVKIETPVLEEIKELETNENRGGFGGTGGYNI